MWDDELANGVFIPGRYLHWTDSWDLYIFSNLNHKIYSVIDSEIQAEVIITSGSSPSQI